MTTNNLDDDFEHHEHFDGVVDESNNDNNDEPDEDEIAIAALELADEERAIEEQIRKAEYLGNISSASASADLVNDSKNAWIFNSNMPDKAEE